MDKNANKGLSTTINGTSTASINSESKIHDSSETHASESGIHIKEMGIGLDLSETVLGNSSIIRTSGPSEINSMIISGTNTGIISSESKIHDTSETHVSGSGIHIKEMGNGLGSCVSGLANSSIMHSSEPSEINGMITSGSQGKIKQLETTDGSGIHICRSGTGSNENGNKDFHPKIHVSTMPKQNAGGRRKNKMSCSGIQITGNGVIQMGNSAIHIDGILNIGGSIQMTGSEMQINGALHIGSSGTQIRNRMKVSDSGITIFEDGNMTHVGDSGILINEGRNRMQVNDSGITIIEDGNMTHVGKSGIQINECRNRTQVNDSRITIIKDGNIMHVGGSEIQINEDRNIMQINNSGITIIEDGNIMHIGGSGIQINEGRHRMQTNDSGITITEDGSIISKRREKHSLKLEKRLQKREKRLEERLQKRAERLEKRLYEREKRLENRLQKRSSGLQSTEDSTTDESESDDNM